MSLWMVRAGRRGDQEQGALDSGVVTIGWNELPDLSNVKDRQELARLYMSIHPSPFCRTRSTRLVSLPI